MTIKIKTKCPNNNQSFLLYYCKKRDEKIFTILWWFCVVGFETGDFELSTYVPNYLTLHNDT